jgi:hypothetical protein
MERVISMIKGSTLVGRGSRMTQRVGEALRVDLRTCHERPQRPPSRDSARRHTIRCIPRSDAAARLVLTATMADPRSDGSAVFRPYKPVDRRHKLTPLKVFGLMGASPYR